MKNYKPEGKNYRLLTPEKLKYGAWGTRPTKNAIGMTYTSAYFLGKKQNLIF